MPPYTYSASLALKGKAIQVHKIQNIAAIKMNTEVLRKHCKYNFKSIMMVRICNYT